MSTLASMDPMVFFAVGITAALVFLLILEVFNSRRVNKLTYPVYEYALKRAEDEAARIVQTAREESRKLIDAAEKESMALVASRKTGGDAAEQAYTEALQSLLARLQSQFHTQAQSAVEQERRISDQVVQSLKSEGETAVAHERDMLSTLQGEIGKRIDEHMSLAFAAADKQIEEYARSRRDLVDAHIADLVAGTMKVVLKKNLPETVHADMVYAALEEAKAENVF